MRNACTKWRVIAEPNMTIDPFLANQAFDAKPIREMSLALESVCNALGLHVDDEAARIKVAEKIIELAGHGMRGESGLKNLNRTTSGVSA